MSGYSHSLVEYQGESTPGLIKWNEYNNHNIYTIVYRNNTIGRRNNVFMCGYVPSSNTDTTTPFPVIPCIQAGSTFKSLPEYGAPDILPVFNYHKKQ